MTLSERIEQLCDRIAAEIKSVKTKSSGGASFQAGKVVFNLDLLRYNRNDDDWIGLVNNQVGNSSLYILRFPKPFASPPVVLLTQERPVQGWRFVEIAEVTTDYAVIRCNYWGSDLTLHWLAAEDN